VDGASQSTGTVCHEREEDGMKIRTAIRSGSATFIDPDG